MQWVTRAIRLSGVVLLCGCSSIFPKNATLLEPAKLFPSPTDGLGNPPSYSVASPLDQFVQAAHDAYASSATADVFARYASKGVTLSDQQCDDWLDALSHQNTEISLGTGWFNIASNTLVSALGLAGAASGTISGVGIGSAAINATVQDYRASVLFTPDFATLHQKISDARKTARTQMLTSHYSNVDDVTRDLIAYDRMCSRDSVQLLLQQSLANSQYQIPTLAQPAANPPAAGSSPAPVGSAPGAPVGAPSSQNRQLLLQSLPSPAVLNPPPAQ